MLRQRIIGISRTTLTRHLPRQPQRVATFSTTPFRRAEEPVSESTPDPRDKQITELKVLPNPSPTPSFPVLTWDRTNTKNHYKTSKTYKTKVNENSAPRNPSQSSDLQETSSNQSTTSPAPPTLSAAKSKTTQRDINPSRTSSMN